MHKAWKFFSCFTQTGKREKPHSEKNWSQINLNRDSRRKRWSFLKSSIMGDHILRNKGEGFSGTMKRRTLRKVCRAKTSRLRRALSCTRWKWLFSPGNRARRTGNWKNSFSLVLEGARNLYAPPQSYFEIVFPGQGSCLWRPPSSPLLWEKPPSTTKQRNSFKNEGETQKYTDMLVVKYKLYILWVRWRTTVFDDNLWRTLMRSIMERNNWKESWR